MPDNVTAITESAAGDACRADDFLPGEFSVMGAVLAAINPDQIQPGLIGGLLGLILVFLPIAAVIVAVVFIVRAVRSNRPKGGWFPDPAGSGRYRWHNGQKWTDAYTDDPSAPPTY